MRVALGAAAFVTVSVPACVEAAGPWRGPIVDVETQEPLEGVVVLASWEREASGHPALPLAFGLTGYGAPRKSSPTSTGALCCHRARSRGRRGAVSHVSRTITREPETAARSHLGGAAATNG